MGNGSVVPLNNGLNSITVTCTDAAGNTGSDTVNVTSDTVEPVVTITAPANGTTFTVNAANLTFGVTDDQDQIPTCDKTSGVDVTLILGDNTITVTCTDEAGNVGSASVNVTYAPPVAQDRVRIRLGNVIIREGDVNKVAYVPITLSAAYGVPITLSYNTQQVQGRGGATSGVDYVAAENELVTIPAGQTSWEIPITIIGDDSRESSENFFVIGDLTIESDAFAILVKIRKPQSSSRTTTEAVVATASTTGIVVTTTTTMAVTTDTRLITFSGGAQVEYRHLPSDMDVAGEF